MGTPAARLTSSMGQAGEPVQRLTWLLLLIGAISANVFGAPPTFQVMSGCRDGTANGAYELRTGDGRLRVAGAFNLGKRTGTFIFWNAAGARLAAIPYDSDAHSGTIALWFAGTRAGGESVRKSESPVVAGVLHGTRFAWHANGRRRSEAEFDHGQLASAQAWDARGRPLAPEAARTAVEQEVRDDSVAVDRLERLVADHRPVCDR